MSEYTKIDIESIIELAKNEECYMNYLEVRKNVLYMMNEAYTSNDVPSNYWEEELSGFDYLLDASPLIVRKMREHCYHITGLKSYDYRKHHSHKAGEFKKKLYALKKIDSHDLFVPESKILGGYGHEIDGHLLNIDTLKFYESLIALDKGGILESLKNSENRPVVVEIGGGWGGFAYQFKKIIPECTYIIIDLPQTMLFSGVYLKTLYPNAKTFIYGENNQRLPQKHVSNYDFIFMPHYSINNFCVNTIDLGINMVSFQEMTSEQVLSYAQWLSNNKCKYIYSHNRARSAHNNQMSDVSSLIGRFFALKEVEILPVPYTVLQLPQPVKWSPDPKAMAKQIVKRMIEPVKSKASSHLDYRHLIGRSHACVVES